MAEAKMRAVEDKGGQPDNGQIINGPVCDSKDWRF